MSCKCHGATFCPDLICVDMDNDVPVFVRRDSPEGQAQIAREATPTASAPVELIERLRRFAEVYGTQKGLPWIGTVRPEQAFAEAADMLERLTAQPSGELIERVRGRAVRLYGSDAVGRREAEAYMRGREDALAAMSEGVDRYE